MHIRRLRIMGFKRFFDLTVDIPGAPKLVVMAGPNGMGKSSLIDAVRLWHAARGAEGWYFDEAYHLKSGTQRSNPEETVSIEFAETDAPPDPRKLVYARTAYRHEPNFLTNSISRAGEILDGPRSRTMIETESKVSDNYQRLISAALDDLFVGHDDQETLRDVRERYGNCSGPLTVASTTSAIDARTVGNSDPRFFL